MAKRMVNRRDFMRASAGGGAAFSLRAQTPGATAGKFFAGAATSNITPPMGSRLGGNYWYRIADDVHDELHVRSLVLDNGRSRLAIAVVDSCALPGTLVEQAKEMIQQSTGVPASNILISATHTHAAPPAAHILQSPPEPKYCEWLTVRIADSVRIAVKRLQPARLGWALGREDRILFTRRYYMKPGSVPPDPFGGTSDKVRTSPKAADPNILGPEGPVDPQVGVLAVESLDGRPICLLGNYGLHSIGEIRPGDVSADYFGLWAEAIARMAGISPGYPPFVPIMSNGCSGCSLSVDYRRPQVKYVLYEKMYRIAEIVAAATLTTWRNLEYRDWAELGATTEELELAVRLPNDADVTAARKILAAAPSEGQFRKLPQIYARETVIMSETFPKTVKVPVQALRIGELGIATFPGEAFPQLGLEVKAKSPFKPTLCIELANAYHGYIPTVEAHANGGYETWRAKSSYLEVQAAPKMVAAALRGLAALSG